MSAVTYMAQCTNIGFKQSPDTAIQKFLSFVRTFLRREDERPPLTACFYNQHFPRINLIKILSSEPEY